MIIVKINHDIKVYDFEELSDSGKSEFIGFRIRGWISTKKRMPINKEEWDQLMDYCLDTKQFKFVSPKDKEDFPEATKEFCEGRTY